jgi:hypothetical protein
MNNPGNDGAANLGGAGAEPSDEPVFEPWRHHRDFILSELSAEINPDAFVSYVLLDLAREIDAAIEASDDDFFFGYSYSPEPMQHLYLWLTNGRDGIDPAWFEESEKTFIRDRTKALPPGVQPVLTPSDHLLAYTFWMLTEELEAVGAPPQEGQQFSDFGWTALGIQEHYSKCVMSGYLGLTYLRELRSREPNPNPVAKGARLVDFSLLGKSGAEKRHAPRGRLMQYAVDLYKKGPDNGEPWTSPNDAAYRLKDLVVAHGRTMASGIRPLLGNRYVDANVTRLDGSPSGYSERVVA